MATSLHGTCVAVGDAGVLLLGPSGSGKSDLALRLIDGGARLVADDRVLLSVRDARLFAEAPPHLPRVLEVRGIGLLPVPVAAAPVALTVVFELGVDPERLPDAATWTHGGLALPLYRLDAHRVSAAARVRAVLAAAPLKLQKGAA